MRYVGGGGGGGGGGQTLKKKQIAENRLNEILK